jgi:pseudaminic acid synthase
MIFNKIKKPYFIAEISANHCGSISRAKKLIELAAKSGADAVKFQTYTADTMTIKSNRDEFKIKEGLWKGHTLWDLYNKAKTPYSWHKNLFNFAKKEKITCFSSPFDGSAVDLLESLNCPFYKVASFELTHIQLIKRIAKTKKPMIMSTGMSNLKEIDLAYKTAKSNGCKEVVLLYCVSNYPSKLTDFNLNNIGILKRRYGCTIGFSDHSIDNSIGAAAVAVGAQVIEKHIALQNQKKGFDVKFSLKGKQIKEYIDQINKTYSLLGKKYFYRSKTENRSLEHRRSIYIIQDIKKNQRFTKYNIKIIRPGKGVQPIYFKDIINKKSPKKINKGTPLNKKLLKDLKLLI